MPDAVCIGGGSQNAWLTLSAQQVLEGYGYSYNPQDPLAETYQQIARSRNPYTSGSKWYAPFGQYAEACMRARAILFCNSTAGDCQTGQSNITSDAGEFLAAGQGAAQLGSFAGPIGSAIGSAVQAIVSIFASHAQAVSRQANALCTLAPKFSEAIYSIDSYVADGQASTQQGIDAIGQLVQQWQASVGSLEKNCNAFCLYQALILCLRDITPYYYAGIQQISIKSYPPPSSPISPVNPVMNPVSAPIVASPITVPAPTTSTGTSAFFNASGNTAPQSTATEVFPGAGSEVSFPLWLIIGAAAILLLAFIFQKGG